MNGPIDPCDRRGDGHDNCAPQGNGVRQFDSFLAREVPKILASPAFGPDLVPVIVTDQVARRARSGRRG